MLSNELKNGAIFIADAHENGKNRKDFKVFLEKIDNGDIKTPQLFLMGDMFDLLVGDAKNTIKQNIDKIEIIEKIAQTTEVFYLEGNHDFRLQKVFKNVKTIPLQHQPLRFSNSNLVFAFSHGDIFCGFWYGLYAKIIRSAIMVFVLNMLDANALISRKILKAQEAKKLCKKAENFHEKIIAKIEKYNDCDFVAEGHYHQNDQFKFEDKKYIALASFACEKVYYVFENLEFKAIKLY